MNIENIYNYEDSNKDVNDTKKALETLKNGQGRYVSIHHEKVIKKEFDIHSGGPNSKVIATDPEALGYHRTMGYAKEPLRNPCDFLRKNEGIKWKKLKNHVCGKTLKPMPPLPNIIKLEKHSQSERNMIKKNIENIKNSITHRPKPKYAITRFGQTRELCNGGVMPEYIFAPTFGRLPKYILKYNQISCEEVKAEEENKKKKSTNNDIYMLDQEERLRVIEGLKKNWYEKQLTYQRFSMFADKQGVKYTIQLEKELLKLENDIVFLEYNPNIYICN